MNQFGDPEFGEFNFDMSEEVLPLFAKLDEGNALLVGFSMLGGLLGIRGLVERRVYLPFWAVRLGYTLGLPGVAFNTSLALQDYKPGKWFDRRSTLLGMWAGWAALGIANYRKGVRTGTLPKHMHHAPSEFAHTVYFPFYMTMMTHAALAVASQEDRPASDRIDALSPLGYVLLGLVLDTIFPNNR